MPGQGAVESAVAASLAIAWVPRPSSANRRPPSVTVRLLPGRRARLNRAKKRAGPFCLWLNPADAVLRCGPAIRSGRAMA